MLLIVVHFPHPVGPEKTMSPDPVNTTSGLQLSEFGSLWNLEAKATSRPGYGAICCHKVQTPAPDVELYLNRRIQSFTALKSWTWHLIRRKNCT